MVGTLESRLEAIGVAGPRVSLQPSLTVLLTIDAQQVHPPASIPAQHKSAHNGS